MEWVDPFQGVPLYPASGRTRGSQNCLSAMQRSQVLDRSRNCVLVLTIRVSLAATNQRFHAQKLAGIILRPKSILGFRIRACRCAFLVFASTQMSHKCVPRQSSGVLLCAVSIAWFTIA